MDGWIRDQVKAPFFMCACVHVCGVCLCPGTCPAPCQPFYFAPLLPICSPASILELAFFSLNGVMNGVTTTMMMMGLSLSLCLCLAVIRFPFSLFFRHHPSVPTYHHRHHQHHYHWSNGIYISRMRSLLFFESSRDLSLVDRVLFPLSTFHFPFFSFLLLPLPLGCVWLSCKIASLCTFFVCAWSGACVLVCMCVCLCVDVDCCP